MSRPMSSAIWNRKLLFAVTVVGGTFAAYGETATWAGTVGTTGHAHGGGNVVFRAAEGETNIVTMTAISPSTYRVEDRGAAITPRGRCEATEDPQMVLCRLREGLRPNVDAYLGDQNDMVRFAAPPGTGYVPLRIRGPEAYGGPGHDTLIGGREDEYLEGQTGNDVVIGGRGGDWLEGDSFSDVQLGGDDRLEGGPGPDALTGGTGSDRLRGGRGSDALDGEANLWAASERPAPEPDRLRGGAGLDLAEYNFFDFNSPRRLAAARRAPRVRVTFDGRPNDGPRGDRDNIARDVERAYSLATAYISWTGLQRRGFQVNPTHPKQKLGIRIYRLSAGGTKGAPSGVFAGGSPILVTESPASDTPTALSLPTRGFEQCRARASGGRVVARASKKAIYSLKGKAKGRFRSRGRGSAATVRGTDWTITDRCDGTLTTVRSGRVAVRDFRRRKTIILRAGESYLARVGP